MSASPQTDDVFAHEYGHVKQSLYLGISYIPIVGIPSFIGSGLEGVFGHNHDNEWYEVWANQLAYEYYNSIGDTAAAIYLSSKNPLDHTPEWYDVVTGLYYLALLIVLPIL